MKLFNKLRSLSRKGKVAITILALSTAFVAVPAVQAEFYPDRPTFDYNKYDPSNQNCDDQNNPAAQNGRCGSMNGPVFNSFINTPSYGDERAFFDGRRSDQSVGSNADDINDVNDGTKEVVLRMYVHNNANQDTNASGKGVAHGTKVRIALPTATEQVLRARAYISADNASMVEDTADLLGTEKFSVSYIPGSAKLLRGTASYGLSDSIVTSGAPIGNTDMNGDLPGCFDYAALIEVHVKVNVQENPKLQLTKEVKVKGATGWNEEVKTKPGTEIQWRMGTKNISNSNINNAVIRDNLPAHLKVVPGSVRLITSASDKVQQDGPLFTTGGFNIGNYVPGSTQYVIFNTVTQDDFAGCEVRLRNYAYLHSDTTPEESDSADVVITKENCQPNPDYKCIALSATAGPNRSVTFKTNATATNGAQIVQYLYDFGDGTTLNTDKDTVNHTYAKDGEYAARVRVQVSVNNTTKYAEGDQCAAPIKFAGSITTTGKPTTLPNTGAGDVAALFAVAMISGTLGYRAYLRRALSR